MRIIPGLKALAVRACTTEDWQDVRNLLFEKLHSNSEEYKQLMKIRASENLILKSCRMGYIELITLFCKNDFPVDQPISERRFRNTMIHVTARADNIALMKYLISRGADVNILNGHMKPPLHIAARFGYLRIVKLLINAGAVYNVELRNIGAVFNIDNISNDINIAIFLAIHTDHVEIIHYMIEIAALIGNIGAVFIRIVSSDSIIAMTGFSS